MSLLTRLLFRIARSPVSALFIGAAFEHLSPIIPLDRRYEDEDIVIIQHPRPFWKFHLVAVPKKRIPTLLDLDLDSLRERRILLATLKGITSLAERYALAEAFMLVNGGRYQDVPQIHFHLMSDPTRTRGWRRAAAAEPPVDDRQVQRLGCALAFPHPDSQRAFHYIIVTELPVPALRRFDFTHPEQTTALFDIFRLAQAVARTHVPQGYMFGTYLDQAEAASPLAFHVFSGSPPRTERKTQA